MIIEISGDPKGSLEAWGGRHGWRIDPVMAEQGMSTMRTTKKGKRGYTLRRRAERQQVTRARIVDAAIELHERLGPKATTITAIADRAGVQRLTVYRHFPDDVQLFRACTSQWLELNPPPDPALWSEAAAGAARTRTALRALYDYYRRTERMWTVALRDRDELPALHGPMAEFDGYLDSVRDVLAEGWDSGSAADGGRRAPVLGHAVRFSTWQSLKDQGLDDGEMAGLIVKWLEAL